MTAKRFKSINCGLQGQYIKDDGVVLTIDEVVELLNEQHEQIQHLESRIKDYDVALKSLQDLTDRKLKENEQLKETLKELKEIGDYQSDRIQELNDENEQLKLDKQHLHQAMSREEVRHKQFKDKVFDLIDKSLEKDKQYYEMTYEDYLNGRIEVLEELRKELE